ncbi:MAG: ABC transporter substrate-binding protein [Armatimonadota bacterium]|nr:ABC transporter substrate-binding protein [Armatimonadota bacterium]MDR7485088.1 ABC transporter substrate-binding protein [Armatimonadota bacterium]MDR7533476.1 ABC transporter substrate-binding protein [Armatimonadota bacterium]MDR7537023.1 ABC transporter substrate-binding protein [Armatimonadota bacterium]
MRATSSGHRLAVVVAGVLLLAAALPVAGAPTPRRGGEFVAVYRAGNVESLDPPSASAGTDWRMVGLLLYNTLYAYTADGRLVPDLAAGPPRVSPNGRVLTVPLRRGVRFHHGREMTAADVKFSLERQAHPSARSWGPSFAANIVGARDVIAGQATQMPGIEVVDDETVRITLEQPQAAFPSILSMSINAVVPREEVERWGPDFRLHPVGTGPFRLERWTPGQEIVFVRHREYFRPGLPYLDRVVYRFGVDPSVGLLRFERGEVDYLADGVAPQDVQRARTDPRLGPLVFVANNVYLTFLLMNTQAAPFHDVRVRRALAHLVDRDRLIQVAGGLGLPANGYLLPQISCHDPASAVPAYDPARARALLAEAGVSGFSVNLDSSTTGSIPFSAEWQQVLQQAFAQVGIRAEIRRFTGGILNRMLADGASVLALNGWGASFLDPVDHVGTLLVSDGANARRARYANPEVDRLFRQAERTASPAVRCRYYRQINRLALEDLPIIPLVITRTMHLRSPRVGQFVWHPIYNAPIFQEVALAR